MSRFRNYTLSARAEGQCAVLGLEPEVALAYARQSAPFTHAHFNRRYEEYVFSIRQATIDEVGLFADNEPAKLLKDAEGMALLQQAHAMLSELDGEAMDALTDAAFADFETLLADIERHIGDN